MRVTAQQLGVATAPRRAGLKVDVLAVSMSW
jgi:hypothetical protein